MKQPLPPQVIEALLGYDSPTIANAIEHFGVRDPTTGYATNELRCQTPEVAVPMVGYALTVTADGSTPGDTRPSRIDEFVELIAAAPKPTVLVVQHVGTRPHAGLQGPATCSAPSRSDSAPSGSSPTPTHATAPASASAPPISTSSQPAGSFPTGTPPMLTSGRPSRSAA